jgi:hypothetical protein
MAREEVGVSKKLPLLGLIASFSGLLLEILSNINKTVESGQKHFYMTLGVLWCATAIFAWTAPLGKPLGRRRIKWLILISSSLLVATLLGFRYYEFYEHTRRITHPASTPQIKLPGLILLPTVFAADAPLRLDSFSVDEDLSSFHMVDDFKFGRGPLVTSYVVDLDVNDAFRKGTCIGVLGDQPAQAAVPVLRNFWSKNGRNDLAAYLVNPDSLGRLIRERGDVFAKIIPTPQQLRAMQPTDYDVVRAWLHDCVGLYNPVFTLVLTDSASQDLVITTVVYHVLDIGQVLGGTGGPIYPLKTYDYTLDWRRGDQIQQLNPPFSVPAHDHAALNLRLSPSSSKHGISWWMNIEVRDSSGHSVKTPTFDLTMNKEER